MANNDIVQDAKVEIIESFCPEKTLEQDLGASDLYWNSLYVDKIYKDNKEILSPMVEHLTTNEAHNADKIVFNDSTVYDTLAFLINENTNMKKQIDSLTERLLIFEKLLN